MNSFPDGSKKKYIIACTGASGVIYFVRLLKELFSLECELHIIISGSGKKVLEHESGYKNQNIKDFISEEFKNLKIKADIFEHEENNFFTPPASGSFFHNGMVIVPSSMKTLGSIASGTADSLILRSADVCLKERRKLVIVPRETPYNRIHMENMIKLNDAGALILPASPSFYHHPRTIEELADSLTARILNHIGIESTLISPWNG
jgi:4-hydroxy-3-polyprenylbenzoate decarboxylase